MHVPDKVGTRTLKYPSKYEIKQTNKKVKRSNTIICEDISCHCPLAKYQLKLQCDANLLPLEPPSLKKFTCPVLASMRAKVTVTITVRIHSWKYFANSLANSFKKYTHDVYSRELKMHVETCSMTMLITDLFTVGRILETAQTWWTGEQRNPS